MSGAGLCRGQRRVSGVRGGAGGLCAQGGVLPSGSSGRRGGQASPAAVPAPALWDYFTCSKSPRVRKAAGSQRTGCRPPGQGPPAQLSQGPHLPDPHERRSKCLSYARAVGGGRGAALPGSLLTGRRLPGPPYLDEGDEAAVEQSDKEEGHEGEPQAARVLQLGVVVTALVLAPRGQGGQTWGSASASETAPVPAHGGTPTRTCKRPAPCWAALAAGAPQSPPGHCAWWGRRSGTKLAHSSVHASVTGRREWGALTLMWTQGARPGQAGPREPPSEVAAL